MISKRPTIKLNHSPVEWIILEEMSHFYGHKDFRTLLNSKLYEIANSKRNTIEVEENCNKEDKIFYVPTSINSELILISARHCAPIGRIASKLVAAPLLAEFYRKNGF